MACTIENISGDKRLRIGNSEILWQFGFGTDWNFIRVAFTYCLNTSVTLPSTQLLVGVNNGTQFGYRSNSCIEYVGIQFANASNSTFTYAAAPAPTHISFGIHSLHYKVGSVDTVTSNNSANAGGSTDPAVRTYVAIDFWKKSNNNVPVTTGFMQAGLWTPSTPPSTLDVPPSILYSMSEYDQQPLAAYGPYTGGTSNVSTLAYNGPYSFDSLSINWGDATHTLEISELLVVRYA